MYIMYIRLWVGDNKSTFLPRWGSDGVVMIASGSFPFFSLSFYLLWYFSVFFVWFVNWVVLTLDLLYTSYRSILNSPYTCIRWTFISINGTIKRLRTAQQPPNENPKRKTILRLSRRLIYQKNSFYSRKKQLFYCRKITYYFFPIV